MKKLILIILLLFSLSTTVYAHSGGTDSQGGHYDDGDYHYHHGYSAHDHYDMDSDGDLDCPYNFHDNVDHKTGGNSTSQPTGKINDFPSVIKDPEDYGSRTEYDSSIIGRTPTFSSNENALPPWTEPEKHANRIPKTGPTEPAEPKETISTVVSASEDSISDILLTSVGLAITVFMVLGLFAGFFSKKIGRIIVGIAGIIFLILMLIYPLTFFLE